MRAVTLGCAVLAESVLTAAGSAYAQPGPPTSSPEPGAQPVAAPTDRVGTWVTGGDKPAVEITYVELVEAGVGERGTPGSVVPPARRRRCELHAAPAGPGGTQGENQHLPALAGGLIEGEWYYQSCHYLDTGELASSRYWQYTPGQPATPGPDLAELARQAYDEIPLAFPVPHTSPAIDIRQLTGLPTWLWVDPATWQAQWASATLAGFTVEVTATPDRLVWDLGDRTAPVTCSGPGTAFDPAGGDDQRTDCSHVYQFVSTNEPGGVYRAAATMVWSVTWAASTGATGSLGETRRTTRFDLRVEDLEAATCYDTDTTGCPIDR
jgi:hypothetical protein